LEENEVRGWVGWAKKEEGKKEMGFSEIKDRAQVWSPMESRLGFRNASHKIFEILILCKSDSNDTLNLLQSRGALIDAVKLDQAI
jgi:hypothetical protein